MKTRGLVLRIFKDFDTRPGEVLMSQNFTAVAAKNGWRNDDIASGIKRGYALGWFEDGPNGTVKLNDSGFAAI